METRPTEVRTPGRWDTVRHGGLGFLLGILLGAVFAGFVYVDGRERLAALDAERAAGAVTAGEELASVREELVDARSYQALLRARIAAGAALDELDRLNFGLSREQLRYVGVALAEVDPARVNVDPNQLAAARELVNANLESLAPDAATQRDRLEAIVRSVDALIPRDRRG